MSAADITRIDIAEFRSMGYLQELNRRFLHPLGLALEVVVDEDGTEHLGGVWDSRDDPEGITYGDEHHAPTLLAAETIDAILDLRAPARRQGLGYVIQPVDGARDLDADRALADVLRRLLEDSDTFVNLVTNEHDLGVSLVIDGRAALDLTEFDVIDTLLEP